MCTNNKCNLLLQIVFELFEKSSFEHLNLGNTDVTYNMVQLIL